MSSGAPAEAASAATEANNGDKQRPETAPVAGRRKMVKPKMDFAKALSIMGFSTSRTLDPSGGHDARVELNAALSRKMADIEKRKRAANKKEQTKVEDKLRDEIRTLHEAYQFLSRKYIKLAETLGQNPEEDNNNDKKKEETKKNSKKNHKKSLKSVDSIDKFLMEEDDDFYDFDEEYDGEFRRPSNEKLNKRQFSIKRKKSVADPSSMKKIEENQNEENNEPRRSASTADDRSSTVEDDSSSVAQDDVFDNVDEMEVSLCQLINDTFKLDDDDDVFK